MAMAHLWPWRIYSHGVSIAAASIYSCGPYLWRSYLPTAVAPLSHRCRAATPAKNLPKSIDSGY